MYLYRTTTVTYSDKRLSVFRELKSSTAEHDHWSSPYETRQARGVVCKLVTQTWLSMRSKHGFTKTNVYNCYSFIIPYLYYCRSPCSKKMHLSCFIAEGAPNCGGDLLDADRPVRRNRSLRDDD
jgi:hypothetical protein